jgi:hypothetical protein
LTRAQARAQNQNKNNIPIIGFSSIFTIRKRGARKKQTIRQIKEKFFNGKNVKGLTFIIPRKKIAKAAENISLYGEISDIFINYFLALQNRDI